MLAMVMLKNMFLNREIIKTSEIISAETKSSWDKNTSAFYPRQTKIQIRWTARWSSSSGENYFYYFLRLNKKLRVKMVYYYYWLLVYYVWLFSVHFI